MTSSPKRTGTAVETLRIDYWKRMLALPEGRRHAVRQSSTVRPSSISVSPKGGLAQLEARGEEITEPGTRAHTLKLPAECPTVRLLGVPMPARSGPAARRIVNTTGGLGTRL